MCTSAVDKVLVRNLGETSPFVRTVETLKVHESRKDHVAKIVIYKWHACKCVQAVDGKAQLLHVVM